MWNGFQILPLPSLTRLPYPRLETSHWLSPQNITKEQNEKKIILSRWHKTSTQCKGNSNCSIYSFVKLLNRWALVDSKFKYRVIFFQMNQISNYAGRLALRRWDSKGLRIKREFGLSIFGLTGTHLYFSFFVSSFRSLFLSLSGGARLTAASTPSSTASSRRSSVRASRPSCTAVKAPRATRRIGCATPVSCTRACTATRRAVPCTRT